LSTQPGLRTALSIISGLEDAATIMIPSLVFSTPSKYVKN